MPILLCEADVLCQLKRILNFGFSMQENECLEQTTSNIDNAGSESNEIRRFELLRNELKELEKRVQRSANQPENEEVYLILFKLVVHDIKDRKNCHWDVEFKGQVDVR